MPAADLNAIASTLREIPFPKKFAVEICADCKPPLRHGATIRRCAGRRVSCDGAVAAHGRPDRRDRPRYESAGSPSAASRLMEPDLLVEMLPLRARGGLRSLNVNTNGLLLTERVARGCSTAA